jgi:glycosyltransferase involved in cell wall biosynthesis
MELKTKTGYQVDAKLKILVCTSEYYPQGSGIANVAYNVVEKLKEKGITCEVCSPVGPDIKLGSEIKYGRMSLLRFWNKVRKHFKDSGDDYDIVWLHNPLFIGKIPFDNCLVTVHTTPHGQVAEKVYPWHLHVYKKIVSHIDEYCLKKFKKDTYFTAVDPTVLTEMVKLGIPKDHIQYIPNGVDIDLFKVRKKDSLKQELDLPLDKEIILSYGRISDQKRPMELIELFAQISQEINNTILVFAGDGELLPRARKMVETKNLQNIKFLGYIDHKKVAPKLLSASDYYILISKYEGQPLTLLEAMASGLKCIVSDIPNLQMIIDDADCGISLDIQGESVPKQIIEYLESDNMQDGKNARSYAVENFDWEIIADKYLDEFKKRL